MEPLAALSLAAAICQLVDFSSKVVREANHIFKTGTSIEAKHMSLVTEDLKKLLSSVKQQLDTHADQNTALTLEGRVSEAIRQFFFHVLTFQALVDLANECDQVAQTLLKAIEQATVNSKSGAGESKPRFRSMYTALKLVWNSKRLNELRDCLSRYREEISLRLLVILNTHQRLQNQKLDQLQQGNQDIVKVLAVQCDTLRLKLEEDHRNYTKLLDTDREAEEKRHAEIIAAVLTSADRQSRTITGKQPD